MNFGVFIERDGVLNQARVERQHQISPVSMAEFHIAHGAPALLARLKSAGFRIIVTTNQPGISQGTIGRRELDRMHDLLRTKLPIDDIFVCPHDQADRCPCRKPRPGLFQEARFKWQLDMDRSFVISDKWQDAQAAYSCGCTSVLLNSPWIGSVHHDVVVSDLAAAVDKVLQLQTSNAAVAA